MYIALYLAVPFPIIAQCMLLRVMERSKKGGAIKEEKAAAVEEAPKGPTELDVLLKIRDSLQK